MDKRKKPDKLIKVADDTIKLPDKRGNGILKYVASANKNGVITRYSLVYINYNLFSKDNGRVLGYDNSHGYHHRHYMGKEERVNFTSYEDIVDRFEVEWRQIHENIKK